MQKLTILLFTLWAFCPKALHAQDALYKEITVIINDLVAKMNTKTGIKNVAISDFTKLDGTPTELGKYLAEQFSDAMVNSTANFSIVDRARLNFLLKEAGLDAKGLLDPNSAAKLGKMKGIDAIVIGTLTAEGENLRVNVKAINLESAVILASSYGYIRRTPAIIALEEKGLGDTPAPTPGKTTPETKPPVKQPPVLPVQATFEKDPLLFECLECKQSGTSVTCKVRIMSKGKDYQIYVNANERSKIIDEEGNDFFMSNVRLANVSGSDQQKKDLVADVPVTSEFTFSEVEQHINSITKMVVSAWGTPYGDVYITLKNIPVKH
ncbi:MAG: FlgO family outer membrane protein [Saprospiraceae bacterium]